MNWTGFNVIDASEEGGQYIIKCEVKENYKYFKTKIYYPSE